MTTLKNPENVFGWLDEIQRRPGMYLGETIRPLEDPQALVGGYTAALHVHGVVENVPSMAHFSTWLRHETGWSTSRGWGGRHRRPSQTRFSLGDVLLTRRRVQRASPDHSRRCTSIGTESANRQTRETRFRRQNFSPRPSGRRSLRAGAHSLLAIPLRSPAARPAYALHARRICFDDRRSCEGMGS